MQRSKLRSNLKVEDGVSGWEDEYFPEPDLSDLLRSSVRGGDMPPALQVAGPAHAAAGQGDHGEQQGGVRVRLQAGCGWVAVALWCWMSGGRSVCGSERAGSGSGCGCRGNAIGTRC